MFVFHNADRALRQIKRGKKENLFLFGGFKGDVKRFLELFEVTAASENGTTKRLIAVDGDGFAASFAVHVTKRF